MTINSIVRKGGGGFTVTLIIKYCKKTHFSFFFTTLLKLKNFNQKMKIFAKKKKRKKIRNFHRSKLIYLKIPFKFHLKKKEEGGYKKKII